MKIKMGLLLLALFTILHPKGQIYISEKDPKGAFVYFPSISQDTITGCHCNCYSRMNIELFTSGIDSVGILLHQKYGRVIGIGSTGYNIGTFLFIVRDKERNRGFYYDFLNKRHMYSFDKYVDSFANILHNDSIYIVSADTIQKGSLSHDWSYYINYNAGKSKHFYQLCQSQVYNMKNRNVINLLERYWLRSDRVFPWK